ncbi:MAG: hypothetical protein V1646_02195 [bacterium]
MAIKLHSAGFEHAEDMIRKGVEVESVSNNWAEVKPNVDDELKYLESHTLEEYGLWYLGVDTNAPSDKRSKFVYPFGDFNIVQESALITSKEDAKKNHHDDIAEAAHKLLTKIIHMKK